MLKSACLLFFVSLTYQVCSQIIPEKDELIGFYGNRFTIQLGAGFHHNTLLKLTSRPEQLLRTNEYYADYLSQIGRDQFNYNLYGNLGVILKKRLSLSLDYQYYSGNIFFTGLGKMIVNNEPPNSGYYYKSKYDCKVKYTTMRFMPRIEIASRDNNTQVGLVNILGVGVELSQIKSGYYTCITPIKYGNKLPQDSVQITDAPLTFTKGLAVNITLLYGLEYRLPISKNLAWNIGANAHLNIPGIFPGSSTEYSSDGVKQTRQLAKYRLQNLFSVRTGIVIML